MAQQINTAGADYIHPGESKFTGGLYIPTLANITDPPKDQGKVALGAYNGIQYQWDTVNQQWIATGSGEEGSDWTPGNSFAS
ncbi:hypothetical protein [Chitinophaga pinensis]|uniref:Uncharacterized protein n=1 Tax=Chitinophaga pinensis (strain ATCC 43595 / DSM 2588 / LMG 13176 / NBRC 15968 / NCIMB 11800 / UQM 2034) TaxID=485918 RepID=A0A979G5U8_CHIPD|nr:hypothetical protein [Chitinophaga pinensis]ACU61366.1 hypothetical protein Cpin_3904 [Chitinophaga pinensis DSM 2588]